MLDTNSSIMESLLSLRSRYVQSLEEVAMAGMQYEASFDNEPKDLEQYDKFLVSIADAVVGSLIEDISDIVVNVCGVANIPPIDEDHTSQICNHLTLMIPGHAPGATLAEIIIGGWRIRMNEAVWRGNRHALERRNEVLNELLLKSLEVAEYNHLISR